MNRFQRVVVVMVALGFILLLLVPAVVAAGGGENESSAPAYVVVLKDGSRIPAKAKPVSAFGKLRFVDGKGRNLVLPASQVDLDKTFAANAEVPAAQGGGTLSISGSAPAAAKKKETTREGADAGEPAAKNLSVKVYSATWCPYCDQLKKFLAAEGISASVTEVDRLPEGDQKRQHAEMRRLTGKVSYPTVVIGDQAMAGFSASWIKSQLGL